MAMALGVFLNFPPTEKVSFCHPFSSSINRPFCATLRFSRSAAIYAAAKPAAENNKWEPRGILKPGRVSPDMQAFLGGVSEIPRTQALKEIWVYIKQHGLQLWRPHRSP